MFEGEKFDAIDEKWTDLRKLASGHVSVMCVAPPLRLTDQWHHCLTPFARAAKRDFY